MEGEERWMEIEGGGEKELGKVVVGGGGGGGGGRKKGRSKGREEEM